MRQSDSETARQAQSETLGVPPRHSRSSAWDRVQRVALAGFGVIGTLGLLGLAACPADLANPQDYDHPGSLTPGGAGGASGGGAGAPGAGGASGAAPTQPGLNVDTTCITAIFTKSCALVGCHAAPAAGAAHLDLSSPNVNTRLIDVVATHELASPDTGCVANQKLIDSANPAQSWLVGKLTTDGKTCGLVMPVGPALSTDDMACFTKYAQDVAAAAKAGGM
ncbi:MAG: hypothetical protein ABUL62_31685 [Myxococcales bacterium]